MDPLSRLPSLLFSGIFRKRAAKEPQPRRRKKRNSQKRAPLQKDRGTHEARAGSSTERGRNKKPQFRYSGNDTEGEKAQGDYR